MRQARTTVATGFRFWLEPGVETEGLSNAERTELRELVLPLTPGELPTFVPGGLSQPAAIEMASRVQLFFESCLFESLKVEEAARFLSGIPNIEQVERPACGYRVDASPDSGRTASSVRAAGGTIEPAIGPGWWKAITGWKHTKFGTIDPQNIAVLDSGVDSSHPALSSAMEATDAGYFPYNAMDTYGHGTHVCSIVAGRPVNANLLDGPAEIHGALPTAKILSFRIFAEDHTISMAKFRSALFAIRYFHTNVKAINLSIWMISKPDQDLLKAFDGLEQMGIVLCACSGNNFSYPQPPPAGYDLYNDSGFRVLYPGRLARILSVGAADVDSSRAPFSRFSTKGSAGWDGNDYYALAPGRWPLVDIVAPGVHFWGATIKDPNHDLRAKNDNNIATDASGNTFARLAGTSMATPLVTAAAGYLRARYPNVSTLEIRQALRGCVADENIPWSKVHLVDKSDLYGSGVVDFAKVEQWLPPNPPDQ